MCCVCFVERSSVLGPLHPANERHRTSTQIPLSHPIPSLFGRSSDRPTMKSHSQPSNLPALDHPQKKRNTNDLRRRVPPRHIQRIADHRESSSLRLLLQTCGEKQPHPEAVSEMLRQISGGESAHIGLWRRVGFWFENRVGWGQGTVPDLL